ncbi:phosphoribosyltransferase [Rhizobium populisoli]|uniref:phosphoribosyltransferase n=1 Tax=Rhizobium populisoli TaxID=2859785 RepID=UPI001FECBF09|nr:phosphoribosyltransferase family protein [Rhizobium populisoli]
MAESHAVIWEDEMFGSKPTFSDREDAGRQLAEAMLAHPMHDPVVMALPRGGVPVAFEVAQRLGIPLDLLIVRKIGAPGHPEYGIGAVVDGKEPHVVISEEAARHFHIPPGYIATERDHQVAEIERRHRMYFGEDEPEQHDHSGRDIILVDDGIANGGSIRAGIHALKEMGVGTIRIAVPVAPRDLLETLKEEVDEIVCLSAPERLEAVSRHYGDFSETTDQDVVRLLKEARRVNRMIH